MILFQPILKNNSRLFVALGLCIIIIALAYVTYVIHKRAVDARLNEANATLFNVSKDAAYVDMQGRPLSLDSYRGSILVVNDWASWSPYAVDELPLLEKVATEYASKNVTILAINRKEDRLQAERFLSTLPVLSHIKIVVDTTDFFYAATGGYAMPETLIYNQAGTIVSHIRGTLTYEELHSTLDAIIAAH
jgi:thiol-disulfide isomerase/thioredoxin